MGSEGKVVEGVDKLPGGSLRSFGGATEVDLTKRLVRGMMMTASWAHRS